MSIVGTRPPLISETNLYEPRHKARLAIKPGITGMWQVSGRSDITDFEEVVRLDKEYIENWDIGLADDDVKLVEWYEKKGLKPKAYYLVVGRFVPENNYETMIREFMKSKTKKDFAIITNVNDKFLAELEERLHFKSDKRIKFVGTVYNKERLMKIRENAYGQCPKERRLKIYCYIAACGLLWSNWCEYKRNLGVEFGEYSLKQYRYAKDFYRIVKEGM